MEGSLPSGQFLQRADTNGALVASFSEADVTDGSQQDAGSAVTIMPSARVNWGGGHDDRTVAASVASLEEKGDFYARWMAEQIQVKLTLSAVAEAVANSTKTTVGSLRLRTMGCPPLAEVTLDSTGAWNHVARWGTGWTRMARRT